MKQWKQSTRALGFAMVPVQFAVKARLKPPALSQGLCGLVAVLPRQISSALMVLGMPERH